MEDKSAEMTIERLRLKIEGQAKVIDELRIENEELYHQYNHLIIRNGKMLRRIDDFQKIIDDLHIRNEELQLINANLMQLNNNLRKGQLGGSFVMHEEGRPTLPKASHLESQFNIDELFSRWKNFPGQTAQNEPNLRKQVVMLLNLYETALRAEELFSKSGVGGVTGARYVSTLKKFELIRFTGARKKGHYEITPKGKKFIESSPSIKNT